MGGFQYIPNLDNGGDDSDVPQKLDPRLAPYAKFQQQAAQGDGSSQAPAQPQPSAPPANPSGQAPANSAPEAPKVDPRLQGYLDQRSQLSTPLKREDYKPSTGQKILGALQFALHPADPLGAYQANRAIRSTDYTRAEADRQKQLAGVDSNVSALEKQYGLEERDFQNRNTAYKDAGLVKEREAKADKYGNAIDPNSLTPDDANNPSGTWSGTTYGGEKRTGLTAPPRIAQLIAKQDQSDNARAITYDPKTKTFQKNGSVYVPKNVEEGATLEAANGVKGAYTQLWRSKNDKPYINDRLPDAPDKSAKPRMGTPAQFAAADTKKNDSLRKAEKDFRSGLLTADDLSAEKQRVQDEYEQAVADLGGAPSHFDYSAQGGNKGQTASTQPATQNANVTPTPKAVNPALAQRAQKYQKSSSPKVNVGDKVTVGGKQYTVKGFNANGKPVVGE